MRGLPRVAALPGTLGRRLVLMGIHVAVDVSISVATDGLAGLVS